MTEFIYDSLINNKLSPNKIKMNRKKFIKYLTNLNLLNTETLNLAFMYLLNAYLNIKKLPIIFEFNSKFKKTAGSFETYKDEFNNYSYKLIVSKPIIKSLFKNNEESLEINGITCYNKLECFILLIEHEFIHFIISYCNKSDWKNGEHSKKFKLLMNNIFGHTSCTHNLLNTENLNIKKELKINNVYSLKQNNQNIKKIKLIKINPKKALVRNFLTNELFRISYNLFQF